ncbi:MAG: hypothetical protein AABX11_03140 [Nanoarchaeota archaeon]
MSKVVDSSKDSFVPKVMVPIMFNKPESVSLVNERFRIANLQCFGYSLKVVLQRVKNYDSVCERVPGRLEVYSNGQRVANLNFGMEGNRVNAVYVHALLPSDGTRGSTNVDKYLDVVRANLGSNFWKG